jgi:hypothetical protein
MSYPPYPQDPNRNPNNAPGSDPYRNPNNAPGSDPYSTPWTPSQYGQNPVTPVPPGYQGQNPTTPVPPTAYGPYTQPQYMYPPPAPPPGSFMPPPQPPISPTPDSTPRKWLLIALAAIIALAGIVFAIFIPYQNAVTEQANATATASTKATATAFVPTATARAIATATATVVNGNPDPYPPTGTLTLFDPLNVASNTLYNGDDCKFSGGGYHVVISQTGHYHRCFSEGSSFSNFAYEVEMKITTGDCGGLLFRSDSQYNQYYAFITQGQAVARSLLSSSSSAINKGLNQSNILAVVANGQHMDLYVNKQHLTSFSDSSYNNGYIGLFASDNTNTTDVAFTNLKVWTI